MDHSTELSSMCAPPPRAAPHTPAPHTCQPQKRLFFYPAWLCDQKVTEGGGSHSASAPCESSLPSPLRVLKATWAAINQGPTGVRAHLGSHHSPHWSQTFLKRTLTISKNTSVFLRTETESFDKAATAHLLPASPTSGPPLNLAPSFSRSLEDTAAWDTFPALPHSLLCPSPHTFLKEDPPTGSCL